MIKIKELMALVGHKRFFILVVMLGLVGLMGYMWVYILSPQHVTLTAERDSVDADRIRLQQEIAQLPDKYKALIESETRLNQYVAKGYYAEQDRILARARLDELRVLSGLRGISYDISPQENVEHPQSYAMNKQVVRSKIEIEFKGLSDLEMRDFIRQVETLFSGLVIVEDVNFELSAALDQQNLENLSKKIPVDFVKGKATFYWYSVIDKPSDAANPQAQAFGGQS
jgi:hypothetical protein